MKKHLFIILIFLSGSLISILKYNGLNVWNLSGNTIYAISILGSIMFIGSIIALNTDIQTIKLNIKQLNQNKQKSLQFFIKSYLDLTSNTKYYFLVVIVNSIIGILLGFKYKKLAYMELYALTRIDSEWKKNIYIELLNARTSFFSLGDKFDFNWGISISWFFIISGLAIFIRNTVYYDKIFLYFKEIKK